MKFVAHRGLAQYYPENTLLALRKALELGVYAVECDVQCSAEGDLFLLHDLGLGRTSECHMELTSLSSSQARRISVHEPKRFGESFKPTLLNDLFQVFDLLANFPEQYLFLEVKKEVFASQSHTRLIKRLEDQLKHSFSGFNITQLIVICYDFDFLVELKSCMPKLKVGWVLTAFDAESQVLAERLGPDFLICNERKLGAELWAGSWQWLIYDICDLHKAKRLQQMGVNFIESWDVKTLMSQWRAHEF
ncbi:glycerophosphodiester phosphodiesterase family protein [Agaribacterium sp. ZY112]|uniref:glycerophosphodiester phosphodiesterase family protein n=1 Tax=Agaribacterium sp. ZY112 TaxID=3233574 RepID=UPI003523D159